MNKKISLAIGLILVILFNQCTKPVEDTLFVELPADETGITFNNEVIQSADNHILNYSYFFNGGGVGVGDFNNDGLVDIYFSANQKSNKLYINKGNLKFEDVTDRAGVGAAEGWKTGVSLTDINQDGWLDIYVCRSAMGDSSLRKNLLYVNNKDLTFTEKASE
jgi:enediyne biosynthesis protein E4